MQRFALRLLLALLLLVGPAVGYAQESTEPAPDQPEAVEQPAPDVQVTPPAPVAPGTVLWIDDFVNTGVGQLPTSSAQPEGYQLGYEDGEYSIRKTNPAWSSTLEVPLPLDVADAVLAVDARLVGDVTGRVIALACRMGTDPLSQYRLMVNPGAGQFKIARSESEISETVLIGWQTSPLIRRGNESNRLQLGCDGSTITAAINGSQVAAIQDSTYPTGQLSIGAGAIEGSPGTSEARFANLVVMQPGGPGTAADWTPPPATYPTRNGEKTEAQIRDELTKAGYGGPWDIAALLAAYERATAPALPPPPTPVSSSPYQSWSKAGYTVRSVPSLFSAFDLLLERGQTWPLNALSKYEAIVDFYDLSGAWGAYLPNRQGRYPIILLDVQLQTASREARAAVIVHEATHLLDDKLGNLKTSQQCFNSELQAFSNAISFWQSIWGPNGKPGVTHPFEIQLNNLLTWWTAGERDALNAAITESYQKECATVLP